MLNKLFSLRHTALGCLLVIASSVLVGPTFAQANYGGIEGFASAFPIQTYTVEKEGDRPRAGTKFLRKRDVTPIDSILIVGAYGFNGNGYVELRIKDTSHWVKRGHVKPKNPKPIDYQISRLNGEIGCPPGQQRVVTGTSRENRSGVARSLGGGSISCVAE